MLIAEEENLREVVAFPMNQQAEDLMMRSPNFVSRNSLDELGIDLKPDKKKSLLNFLLFKTTCFLPLGHIFSSSFSDLDLGFLFFTKKNPC